MTLSFTGCSLTGMCRQLILLANIFQVCMKTFKSGNMLCNSFNKSYSCLVSNEPRMCPLITIIIFEMWKHFIFLLFFFYYFLYFLYNNKNECKRFSKNAPNANSLWRAVHLVVAPGAERHQVGHVVFRHVANVIPAVGVLLREQVVYFLC